MSRTVTSAEAPAETRSDAGTTLAELVVAAALLLVALGLTATVIVSLGAMQRTAVDERLPTRLESSADRVVRIVRSARPSATHPAIVAEPDGIRVNVGRGDGFDDVQLRILVRDGALVVEPWDAAGQQGLDVLDGLTLSGVLVDGLQQATSHVRGLDTEGAPSAEGAGAELVVVQLVVDGWTATRIVRSGGGSS